MIWIALIVAALVFIKLGMLILILELFTIAIKFAIFFMAGLVTIYMCRNIFRPKLKTCKEWPTKHINYKGD